MMKIRIDCAYFLGDKPCRYKRECDGCAKYKIIGKRILILKLGSMGDVLRTTPLLRGLKKEYPSSHITWVTREESLAILANNPYIDTLLPYGVEAIVQLLAQDFDLVISLDKTSDSTGLAELVKSSEKMGFGLAKEGRPYPFNAHAEYAFNLGISDRLKFHENKKSYPEIIFEVANLEYNGEEYVLPISSQQLKIKSAISKRLCLKKTDRVIGLNTGCGDAFQGKKWTVENFLKLGEMIDKSFKAKILLLGGPNEIERNRHIMASARFPVIDSGCKNSLEDFISIVDLCHIVVCGDTIAMHIAIALKKKVVALFGPTAPQEIDLYGRGEKIISKTSCSPCYKRLCDKDDLCMRKLKPETVFKSIKRLI